MGQTVLDFHSSYLTYVLEFNAEGKKGRKLGYELMNRQKINHWGFFWMEMQFSGVAKDKVCVSL